MGMLRSLLLWLGSPARLWRSRLLVVWLLQGLLLWLASELALWSWATRAVIGGLSTLSSFEFLKLVATRLMEVSRLLLGILTSGEIHLFFGSCYSMSDVLGCCLSSFKLLQLVSE